MSRARIAAVVVRWKNGEEIEVCLRSLMSCPALGPSEIVLVDAGSGDGGAEHLARTFPEIRIEALPDNPGFAGAANHGVTSTDAEMVFLLNPDTEILGPALSVLAAHLDTNPDLVGVVPLLENTDGSIQHRWQLKHFPTEHDLGMGRSGRPQFRRAPENPTTVCQPAAAAWLIRREVWDSLGGLDQSFYPAWWEDVDFCARLRDKLKDPSFSWNKPWRVVPEARVRHVGGSSVKNLGKGDFLKAFFSNLLHYAGCHHPQQLPMIRKRLRLALMVRAVGRPHHFRSYKEVWRALESENSDPTPAPGP